MAPRQPLKVVNKRWDDVLFWFIRHGRTEANDENIYRSWSNAPKAQLDDAGRKDADDAGVYLAAIKAPIKIIIADALDRTVETAERIGYKLGVEQFVFIRGLHPLHMGDYTLKSKEQYPVLPFYDDASKKIPGGESRNDFNKRQQQTFRDIMEIVATLPGGAIAIVGHGSNVSYLHNHVFNPEGENVIYEGLVNPGGVLMASHSELKPLTRPKKNEETKVSSKPSFDVSIERLTVKDAGYMELPEAVKDGDCRKVKVFGGVSKLRGCCNEFEPEKQVTEFQCGTCEYVTDKQ